MKTSITILSFLILSMFAYGQGSGNTASFNGSSYIDVDSSYRIMSNPITLTCWLKRTNNLSGRIFMSSEYSIGYSGIYVQVTSVGEFAFCYGDGAGFSQYNRQTVITSNSHLYLNEWVHCAFVMTGLTSGKIYINGVEVSTVLSGSGGPWFQSVVGEGRIGLNKGNNGLVYHTGDIDELTIWSKALTSNEVKSLVCRKVNSNAAQLLGYYKFDSQVGSQIFDSSPNAHDGSFVGNVTTPISGASIGDTSYFNYSNTPISSFSQTLTTGHQLEVSNINYNVKGVQVYEVFAQPNSFNGLPANANTQKYFGVYLARTDNSNKTYKLKINNYNSSMSIYQRNGNTDPIWTVMNPISVSGTVAEFQVHTNAKEYYIVDLNTCSLDLGPDLATCFPVNIWVKDLSFNPIKTYTWNGTTVSDSLQVTAPGTYYVEMDSAGCVRFDTIVIKENKVSLDLGSDLSLCDPISIWVKDLNFNPAKTYTWNGTTVSDSIQITNAQRVYVEVDSAGCLGLDTIDVLLFKVSVNLGGNQQICTGQSVWIKDLNYSPGKTYNWGNGTIADSIEVTSAQQITVQADSAGCSGFDTITVSNVQSNMPIFDTVIEKCEETPLYIEFPIGDYSFAWPNGSINNSFTIFTQEKLVFYTISPCKDSVQHHLTIDQITCNNPCYLFVPNAFSPNEDLKNPVFKIGVNCELTYFSIQIFNRWGNAVYHSMNPYFEWDGTYEGKYLQEGAYTFLIEYSGFDYKIQTKYGAIRLLR